MKKAIIFISIALVLVLIISFFALYMIGDRILNQLIDSEVARIDAMVEDEIDSFGSNNDAPEGQLDDSRKEPPKKEGQKEDTEKSTNISGDSQKGEKEPVAQEQKVRQTTIPTEKIKQVKDTVTASDRVWAASLVLKRLSASDIDELKGMLSGGISKEEHQMAMQMLYSRFTDSEIEEIKKIYDKYMK